MPNMLTVGIIVFLFLDAVGQLVGIGCYVNYQYIFGLPEKKR